MGSTICWTGFWNLDSGLNSAAFCELMAGLDHGGRGIERLVEEDGVGAA